MATIGGRPMPPWRTDHGKDGEMPDALNAFDPAGPGKAVEGRTVQNEPV